MNIFGGGHSDAHIIIDVGNGSIGAGVAVLEKNKKPRMVSSTREIITFEEKPTAEKLREVVIQKIEKVVPFVLKQAFTDTYFKKHPKHMAKVLCVLSSPWFSAKGKEIKVSEKNDFTITRAFLNEIVSKELAVFEQEINQNDPENPSGQAGNLRVIEKSIIGNKVKGYSIDDIIGKSTNQVEMSVYMSYAQDDFIKRLTNSISKSCHAPDKDLLFHSFPLVTFSAIRELFPGMNDYIHLDIAGEITDVALVGANMIKKTVSFPSGKNLILRQISKQFDVPIEVARSLLHTYMDKRANKALENGIHTALAEAQKEWNIYIEDTVSSLIGEVAPTEPNDSDQVIAIPKQTLPLPKKVFITSYPQTAEIFTDFLKSETADVTSNFRKNVSVSYLGSETLASFLTYNQTQVFDAFLAIEAIFLSRLV